MPFYITRQAPKLWRKICTETTIEISLVAENWKLLIAGIVFQYIHGLAAHGIHYLHRPGPTLQDAGFFLLPELGQDRAYISETSFHLPLCFFCAGKELVLLQWTLHPFVFQNKKIYTVLIWCRVLAYLVACQILRIFTFYSTHLPGPNYHCHEGSKLARLPHPKSAIELLVINFSRGVNYGCERLIFTFSGNLYLAHTCRCSKQFAWLLAVAQSFLIVASHKHYTVDVVVAWYTVNLVTFFIDKKLPDLPERPTGLTSLPPLPQSRDWDSKTKEEHLILLTGVTVETAG
ncbi:hypothetical protein OIU84_025623 [Salix udensis]|uniref:Sphingomyelin synthase-like domain-containing protein n=1 Tax=Salix udensis TaxID=889485 RepID=A0AAD6PDA3_9ROSI|nr:hypothetical protein OIU84_025623 [Salix udensis]